MVRISEMHGFSDFLVIFPGNFRAIRHSFQIFRSLGRMESDICIICVHSFEIAHTCRGCNALRPSTINLAVLPPSPAPITPPAVQPAPGVAEPPSNPPAEPDMEQESAPAVCAREEVICFFLRSLVFMGSILPFLGDRKSPLQSVNLQ